MLTKNNWYSSNLGDRLVDKSSDFHAFIRPYNFKKMNFNDASEMTALEIAQTYPSLFLSYSGGLDSEYLLRLFHRLNIPVKPIIVCCGNEIENKYAHNTCNELNIEPIVINVTEEEFLENFKKNIYDLVNGVGIHSTQPIFAIEYVAKHSGTLLMGDHLIGDDENLISEEEFVSSNEWDFYSDYYAPNTIVIDPFLYTLELTYSMLPVNLNISWMEHKSLLYGIPPRKKHRAIYSDRLTTELINLARNRVPLKKVSEYWSKNEFNNLIKNYFEQD